MKKWHIRTLCILALGAVGLVALAYRPAFETDLAEMPPFCENTAIKLSRHDGNNDVSFEHRWDLSKSPKGTLLSGELQQNAFNLIQPAEWVIKVYTENGQLKAATSAPVLHAKDTTYSVKTRYYTYFKHPTLHYSPNGNRIAEHHLHLCCEITITPTWWRTPITTKAEQILSIYPSLGCADIITPSVNELQNKQLIANGEDAKLPARFCGSKREQVLQFLLYEFADAALSADATRLQRFYAHAHMYAEQLTTADKEWPLCWEEAAPQAQRGAQLIEQTLTIIQQHNCYDMQELADFINGPVFARIFGTQLKKREKINFGEDFDIDTQSIDFEIISEEEFYSKEVIDKKN